MARPPLPLTRASQPRCRRCWRLQPCHCPIPSSRRKNRWRLKLMSRLLNRRIWDSCQELMGRVAEANHPQPSVPPQDRRSPILLLLFKTRARSSTRRKLPSRTNGLPKPRPPLRKPLHPPARRLPQERLGHPFHCRSRQMAPALQPISFRPRASRRATARCPLLLVIPSYPRLSAPILSNS